MSGVVALFEPGLRRHELATILEAMSARLAHRGPDGSSTAVDDGVGVSMRMMATTPEDEAEVVAIDRAGLWLAADARLDDRGGLVEALGGGDAMLTRSDPELIAQSYRRWGRDCVHHLVGEFAFVIVEPETRRLFAARDRLGVRPLYFHANAQHVACASEPHALFAHPDIERRADLAGMADYIVDDYTERDRTLWKNVRALPAAHRMSADGDGVTCTSYWRPDPWRTIDEGSVGLNQQIRDRFRTAVSARSRSNRPLAVALSGGLDSASVLGQLEALRRASCEAVTPVTAMHLWYEGTNADERRFSELVARVWGAPFELIRPLADPARSRPTHAAIHPDVFYDPRINDWALLVERARERDIRTVLTGDGVDLVVRPTGYEIADDLSSGQLAAGLAKSDVGGAPWAASSWRSLGAEVWRTLLRPNVPPSWRRHVRRALGRSRRHPLLSERYAEAVVAHAEQRQARFDERSWPSRTARALCEGLEDSYYQAALATQDRLAAALGTEVRAPWQDIRVVELLLAIPHHLRLADEGGPPKPILRQAMRQLVPTAILGRTDTPHYAEPMRRALFDHHTETVRGLLRNSRLVEAGLAHPNLLTTLERHEMPTLWVTSLVAMELWMRHLEQ